MRALLHEVYADADVTPSGVADGLEVITRHGADAVYRIAVNHRDDDVELEAAGVELLSGAEISGALTIAAGGVAVIRTSH